MPEKAFFEPYENGRPGRKKPSPDARELSLARQAPYLGILVVVLLMLLGGLFVPTDPADAVPVLKGALANYDAGDYDGLYKKFTLEYRKRNPFPEFLEKALDARPAVSRVFSDAGGFVIGETGDSGNVEVRYVSSETDETSIRAIMTTEQASWKIRDLFIGETSFKTPPPKVVTDEDLVRYNEKRKEEYVAEHGKDAYDRRALILGLTVMTLAGVSVVLLLLFFFGKVREYFLRFPREKRIESVWGAFADSVVLARLNPIPRGYGTSPSWGLIAVMKSFLVYLFLSMVTMFIVFGVSPLLGLGSIEEKSFFSESVARLLMVPVFIFILRFEYKSRNSELGIRREDFLRGLKGGFFGYGAFALPVYLFIIAWGMLTQFFDFPKEANPILEPLLEGTSPKLTVLVLFLTCVVAPVSEEFFFRGMLYSALRERLGFPLAALISGVLFGVVHAGPFNWPPLVLIGIMLAYIYERTRSLLAPMVAHAVHNSFVMAMFFLAY